MSYFVYYLESAILGKNYIGKTDNLARRLKEHFNSEEVYTSRANDWKLVGCIDCGSNQEAVKLENRLKKAKNKKYTNWYFEKHGNKLIP